MSDTTSLSKQFVKPEWIDYNGHMNVAYYTMAFDYGWDAFLAHHFGLDEEAVRNNQAGPFMLQSNVIYYAELREADEFTVDVRIIDCSEKLIHLFSTMHRSRDGKLSSTSETLSIYVDHQTRKSTPFPKPMFDKARRLILESQHKPLPQQVGQVIKINQK